VGWGEEDLFWSNSRRWKALDSSGRNQLSGLWIVPENRTLLWIHSPAICRDFGLKEGKLSLVDLKPENNGHLLLLKILQGF